MPLAVNLEERERHGEAMAVPVFIPLISPNSAKRGSKHPYADLVS